MPWTGISRPVASSSRMFAGSVSSPLRNGRPPRTGAFRRARPIRSVTVKRSTARRAGRTGRMNKADSSASRQGASAPGSQG